MFAISFCFAQNPQNAEQNATQNSIQNDTTSADLSTFADINIFSNMPLGSVYILWQNIDLSADIVRQITTRNFVLEPYFMQNIDRESFEQNQMVQIFAEQKKAFFKLFPDEEEED
ncbi:hypothetical protein AGMMS49938_15030 [Fibrobacterales bacterium]|nr:hypothetical protein AGMMS49938_15030 [Fibrobacterales bacterium]